MLKATMPIATGPDEIWVFVSIWTGAVDVARMAHCPDSHRFIALPIHVFNPGAVLPTYTATGELVPGFRWATVADIEAYPDLFTS
ncbi:hypothetical protein [Amycolatopsis pigmentata]|jgi:hypothetical protein|uniref:Uncharacterized protein n=1 Tax=Amycolatopsis pigmentata TaxID=450801 RepID=A0ABW5G0M0_9PSEU